MGNNSESETWQLEEYKLLSSHYFHEDNFFLKSMTIYSALNTAFIAIGSSEFFMPNTFLVKYGLPLLGIVSSIIWFASLVRVRYLRVLIENRIREIESQFEEQHGIPLRIRNRKLAGKWDLRSIPVSIAMRAFPVIFFLIWSVTLLFAISG
jgi:hypothetical protein